MIIEPNINQIVDFLNQGLVVALPTETVYGLAVKYNDIDAINKMSKIKSRENKPYTMMLANTSEIHKFAIINGLASKIIKEYLPGKITIVLPKNPDFKNEYFNQYDTLGIRIPDHKLMIDILIESGPLLVSSANKSGENPCINSDEVLKNISADIIVKGESDNNLPSTVIKIEEEIKVLRQGDIEVKIGE